MPPGPADRDRGLRLREGLIHAGGLLNPRLPVLLLVCVAACGGGGPAAAPNAPPPASPQTFELGRLDDPATLRGDVGPADLDLARFEAPAFGRLVVGLDLPAGCDADLALSTDDGLRLAASRADNRDAAVGPTERLYAWVHPGPYRLEVVGHAGTTGPYVLRLEIDHRATTDPVTPGASATAALGDLAVVRCFHAVAPLPDGGALVAGGTRDPSSQSAAILNADRTTDRFDVGGNAFAPGPNLSSGRFALSATVLPTGRVLLAGGDLGGTANLFDPRTGVMSGPISMAHGMRVMHTATLLPDGRVLLTGGTRVVFSPSPTAENLATTEIYDPKTRAFTAGPAMDVRRTSHAAVCLLDGRVLVIGGVGRATTEILDVRDGASAVSYGPGLTIVRDDHTATRLLDGRVLVLGGQDGTGRSLDSAEILEDPAAAAAGAFQAVASRMGSRRADHRAVRLPSGQVLVLGGEDDPGNGNPDVILTTVDVFDPAAKTFTAFPPLAVGRDDHRVARLVDGRVLVTGGEDAAMASIASVEAYAPR